ncbi:MAG: hypothetical protein IKQ72_09340 [Bacteroidaceae bacterium]|nr:hypothetical protein [Bacteroidaceae bacterium]
MEKIELKFSAQDSCSLLCMVITMTLQETRKKYTIRYNNHFRKSINEFSENKKELKSLPKCILEAFTENEINKILSKDEIPNESGMMVLDGYHYEITITKGDISKVYYANDANIQTYPLLRHLADWCRRL